MYMYVIVYFFILLKKEKQWLCLHVTITNLGSSAKVKEKAIIRNLSKAGGAGASITMDNVMWRGQILEPTLHCKMNICERQ